MKYLAAVDIGNSTTEVCLAAAEECGKLFFLCSASVFTTGIKGTVDNIHGILNALEAALAKAFLSMRDLELILLNEAAPVIGGAAMETITETVVTGSSMLGHNPKTPAGFGAKSGETLYLNHLDRAETGKSYIVIVPAAFGYAEAARVINQARDVTVAGAVLQQDEAVLVYNRLERKIPILDEVREIGRIDEGVPAAIEVALQGQSVRMLSNPYGIATLLHLTPEETSRVIPIAKSLTGTRSAVVFKTSCENKASPIRKAGRLFIHADGKRYTVDVEEGAERIMQTVDAFEIDNIESEPGTHMGDMFGCVAAGMQGCITDIFAVDILAPVKISGALAGEVSMEKAVAAAVMVKAGRLPMGKIAGLLSEKTGVFSRVAGVESVMAALGSLTTPGVALPVCVLDLGGGSTDAAYLDEQGVCCSVCLAGAGELVTLIIRNELGLTDPATAENIKKYPAVRCESLFHIRLENNDMLFVENGLDAKFFGCTALLTENGLLKIEGDYTPEKIAAVRKEAKRKVFVTNTLRALKKLAGGSDLTRYRRVVLVGGSAEDFEIPEMVAEALAKYKIVCGRANIRKTEGARNAVATGLLMAYAGE